MIREFFEDAIAAANVEVERLGDEAGVVKEPNLRTVLGFILGCMLSCGADPEGLKRYCAAAVDGIALARNGMRGAKS